jgi:hypothetical protein
MLMKTRHAESNVCCFDVNLDIPLRGYDKNDGQQYTSLEWNVMMREKVVSS